MRRLRLIIECATPLHCGGGDESLEYDQPVARDAFGFWRIPGSTIAGVLRHEAVRHTSRQTADSAFGIQDKAEIYLCSALNIIQGGAAPSCISYSEISRASRLGNTR